LPRRGQRSTATRGATWSSSSGITFPSPTPRCTSSLAAPIIAGVTYFTVICDPLHRKSAGFIGRNENIVSYESHDFQTVRHIEEKYGGPLFPDRLCNTEKVDETKWWRE
jgi:hypothetical protein